MNPGQWHPQPQGRRPKTWAELTGYSQKCRLHCEDNASQEILFQGPCSCLASDASTEALLGSSAPSQLRKKRLAACLPIAPKGNVIFVNLSLQQKPHDQQAILFPLVTVSHAIFFSLAEVGSACRNWERPDPCGRRKVLVLALPQHSELTHLRAH